MSRQATLGPVPAGPPATQGRSWGPRRVRVLGALTGALVVLAVAGLALWLPNRPTGDTRAADVVPLSLERPVVSPDGLAERSGVKITHVAVTGGGGLIDLRYRVFDPDKANTLHDKRTPPTLVDEQSGLVVNQTLMNHAHHGPYKAGVSYYLVFNNPGNLVRRGGMVTVLLGDAEVQHVVVR